MQEISYRGNALRHNHVLSQTDKHSLQYEQRCDCDDCNDDDDDDYNDDVVGSKTAEDDKMRERKRTIKPDR